MHPVRKERTRFRGSLDMHPVHKGDILEVA